MPLTPKVGVYSGDAKGLPSAINMPLRLMAGRDETSAQLWLVSDDALGWLSQFVNQLEGQLLNRFTFAIADRAGQPLVLLRSVFGKEPVVIADAAATGFRPLLKLPNLFVPSGYRLSPLPRCDA